MNRRTFFQRTAGALVAAVLTPVAAKLWPVTSVPLTFKGIPLVFNQFCPSNKVYFLARNGVHELIANEPVTLSRSMDMEWVVNSAREKGFDG